MDPEIVSFTLNTPQNENQVTVEYSNDQRPMCPFFSKGKCRYGEKCWYYHPPQTQGSSIPGDYDCNICLQPIKLNGQKFGLLQGCDHVFCLPCIREWRGQLNVTKEVSRSCPVCRVLTHYIIPSSEAIFDYQEKQRIAEGYKTHLNKKACKYFNFGEGQCPFGSSCFYEHRYRNGQLWVPPRPQFMVDESGAWKASNSANKLSDLLGSYM